jgi:hypothetical protein
MLKGKFKMKTRIMLCAMSLVVASCGGGGGGGESSSTPASFWSMDGHTYTSGGYSTQSDGALGGHPVTIAVVSTATLAGDDKSNGAYSGSALTFSFAGGVPGTFNVVKDKATFVSADPSTSPILVESNIGIAVTTGATLYTATSGQVAITRNADGKLHFDSVTALPADKTLDVSGGISGAPRTMALTIHNAF